MNKKDKIEWQNQNKFHGQEKENNIKKYFCFIIFVPDILPNMTEADGRFRSHVMQSLVYQHFCIKRLPEFLIKFKVIKPDWTFSYETCYSFFLY